MLSPTPTPTLSPLDIWDFDINVEINKTKNMETLYKFIITFNFDLDSNYINKNLNNQFNYKS